MGKVEVLNLQLRTKKKIIDGKDKTYFLDQSLLIPQGKTLRNCKFKIVNPGINAILVESNTCLQKICIEGSGKTNIVERGVFTETDGVHHVKFEQVEIINITYGVHFQPLSKISPHHITGNIKFRNIVGLEGVSEGYGLLLSPANNCKLSIEATNIHRHAVYLSAGASNNCIDFVVNGCQHDAVTIYSKYTQRPCTNNRLSGAIEMENNINENSNNSGLSICGNVNDNCIINYSFNGSAYSAIKIEGSCSLDSKEIPINNSISLFSINGRFAEPISILCAENTFITKGKINADFKYFAIAFRVAGSFKSNSTDHLTKIKWKRKNEFSKKNNVIYSENRTLRSSRVLNKE